MKQPIRYFSIGLLTASLIILIVISFFEKGDDQQNEGSVDEMIATLTDEGYHVLSSSEYISLSVSGETEDRENSDVDEDETDNSSDEEDNEKENVDETENDNKDDANNEEEIVEEEDEEEEVHKYTLTIEPNMLGPEVSELLKNNNIISDDIAFNRYLETEGYAPYLQLGDHQLSSDMSNYEIAEIIAKSP